MNNALPQTTKAVYNSRWEQTDASVRVVFSNNAAYYDALCNLPSRVNSAMLELVMDGVTDGIHFRVIRAALRQFHRESGFMSSDEAPFRDDEMDT